MAMLYTSPTPNLSNLTPQNVQNLPVQNVPEYLQHDNISDLIKKLLLKYGVNQAIRDDEAQHVTTGVEIMDMQTGHMILSHNIDTQQFAASINKLPVSLLVLQDLRSGKLNMDQMMQWKTDDVRAGAGVYDQPGAPTQAPLRDVIFDLLNRSGNTAVRILVNYALGGAATVNDRWAAIPELADTRLQPLDATRFYVGNSTPRDALWSMTQLMMTQDTYSSFMKHAMATNIYTDISVRSQLAGNDYITLVNKVGLLDDPDGNNRHDVGIVYNTRTHKSYGYALFTTSPYDSTTATPVAEQSLKDMGRDILRFSGDRQHATAPSATPSFVAQRQVSTQPESRILY